MFLLLFICIIRSRWTTLVNLQRKDMIDKLHLLYAVYGMAVMFHFMMAWLFIYRRQSRVRILLCSLMSLMGVNYFKDIFFLGNPDNVAGVYSVYSPLIASIDITALPLFVLVLIELCFPRFLTFFKGTVIIAPFALCVALFLSTLSSRIYFFLYALSVVYGILAIILVLWRLLVYRRLILQEYSNINKVHFHWTYYILSCFIAMLITWMIRTATKNMYADMLYIFISIFGWALVANCLVQIETVVKSVIMNGFDDIDAYHTFLADKERLRFLLPYLVSLRSKPQMTVRLMMKNHQKPLSMLRIIWGRTMRKLHPQLPILLMMKTMKVLTAMMWILKALQLPTVLCSQRCPTFCLRFSRKRRYISIQNCVFPLSLTDSAPIVRT